MVGYEYAGSDLIIGRFQPVHNGHVRIITSVTNPIVCVVGHTGIDARNPLSTDERLFFIEQLLSNMQLDNKFNGCQHSMAITWPTGYLPDIITAAEQLQWASYNKEEAQQRLLDYEPCLVKIRSIVCGEDRADEYNKQLKQAGITIPIQVINRDSSSPESSTAVRETVINDDRDSYRSLVPKEAWGAWHVLRQRLSTLSH